MEPLLGAVDISPWLCDFELGRGKGKWDLRWIIAGGESGANARPMHPDWVRSIRDKCNAAGVPFHFKQWGEWIPISPGSWVGEPQAVGSTFIPNSQPGDMWLGRDGYFADKSPRIWSPAEFAIMRKVGKKAAGRTLDGRTWDEFPKVAAHA
jgi:protein gp37